MNYLAHAYLSFSDPEILVGNLISDFVKGKKKFDYPREIQKGIILHRSVDEFTDKHPVTQKAKQFFRPAYGLYSGPLMDICYDHFLALDKNEFPDESSLALFSEKTFEHLAPFLSILPEKFREIFPYMQGQNWLFNYRLREGIYNSFRGLVRRAAYLDEYKTACSVFDKYYTELGDFYHEFFPDLKKFSNHVFQDLKAEN